MLLVPWPRLVIPLAVFLVSILLSFLLLDSLVFAENRYHLGFLTFSMLGPHTWAFLLLYLVLGTVVEGMVALWIWRRVAGRPARRIEGYAPLAACVCPLAGNNHHAWPMA